MFITAQTMKKAFCLQQLYQLPTNVNTGYNMEQSIYSACNILFEAWHIYLCKMAKNMIRLLFIA
jgi:hypothetical protein